MAIEGLIGALGGHPTRALGLDLDAPGDRARWLVAARLASERDPETRTREAFRLLDAENGTDPASLANAPPTRIVALLARAGLRRPEPVAHGLCRAARALALRHGDLEALATACDDLETLGSSLAALAPGLGRATVLRFLRPLRETWSAARETPLSEPARVAAAHLGLIDQSDDRDDEPAALRTALVARAPGVRLADAEAALERLGALACRTGRSDRCPLGERCPARRSGAGFR